MKFYIEIFRALFGKFIIRENSGQVIKRFSEKMGIVYIKLSQILSTLTYGDFFTEEDRVVLSSICDNCVPVSYKKIKKILRKEYGNDLSKIFKFIEKKPIGSASVSQVHRALLVNGDEVAIKIKREDITGDMNKDILKIKKLIHKYGKFFNFGNFKGLDLVLKLYLSWILEEMDFDKEKDNIKKYSKYIDSVNNKVCGVKLLRVPKVYDEYCTSNVIVMEYVKACTINKMELTKNNKEKIVDAVNSYVRLNFWAMFNDIPIAFHGDPHSANLAIDNDGNLWFLDMGLLFVLNKEESKLCRDFFLTIYMGDYEKLYDMLVVYGDLDDEQKIIFKDDLKKYIDSVRDKNVTHYFIDLVGVCLKFEFVPPAFLLNMGKAFICVYGISNYSDNGASARDLLKEQVILFMIKNKVDSFNDVIVSYLKDIKLFIQKEDDLNIIINKYLDYLKEAFDNLIL